jgi:hypothetical protein
MSLSRSGRESKELGAVGHYIHLNPVGRVVKLEELEGTVSKLWYLAPKSPSSCLSFDAVLGAAGELADRRPVGTGLPGRNEPPKRLAFDQIKCGWAIGSEA